MPKKERWFDDECRVQCIDQKKGKGGKGTKIRRNAHDFRACKKAAGQFITRFVLRVKLSLTVFLAWPVCRTEVGEDKGGNAARGSCNYTEAKASAR
jgi:hypothetical protein